MDRINRRMNKKQTIGKTKNTTQKNQKPKKSG